LAQLSHWTVGELLLSSLAPHTHRVESAERVDLSVVGVFVLDGRSNIVGGEGGEGNLVMSIIELERTGFVAARRGLMVALGSQKSNAN
jgi:hypothetical protein